MRCPFETIITDPPLSRCPRCGQEMDEIAENCIAHCLVEGNPPDRRCQHWTGEVVRKTRCLSCNASKKVPIYRCPIQGECFETVSKKEYLGNSKQRSKDPIVGCYDCEFYCEQETGDVEMLTGPILDTFERVYCVNLARRKDRWEKFESQIPDDWPFVEIERADAIDGKKCPRPGHWKKQGGGAWGCYRSHLRIIEQCLNEGVHSVLLLEDDAVFCQDFSQKVREFLSYVPRDWGMLYLGGQHLNAKRNTPLRVNDHAYRPYNVNRTHAFALRGEMLKKVYQHLHKKDWHGNHHIDHHLGRLHQRREDPIYCPAKWLVGQAEGKSNISGRKFNQDRFWPASEKLSRAPVSSTPFVVVLGLHSSGSSCLAGVLYHLGVHLGNNLGGYYGSNPDKSCGFEAVGLANLCERAIPLPATAPQLPDAKIFYQLKKWINGRRREAQKRGTIAGGKYPQLCQMGKQLWNICGDQLRVVHIDRPLEESIESLSRRCPKKDPGRIADHQRWLWEGKQELLDTVPAEQQITVSYHDLLASPSLQVPRVAEFLDLSPLPLKLIRAIASVDPAKQHVKEIA